MLVGSLWIKRPHSPVEKGFPISFSFNNPFGACPTCQRFRNTIDLDLDLIIPDQRKTLLEGAVDPWTKPRYRHMQAELYDAVRSDNTVCAAQRYIEVRPVRPGNGRF